MRRMIARNDMRGRVMSIYMLAFRGRDAARQPDSACLATVMGAPRVIAINGALLVGVALYFLVKNHGVPES